MVYNFAVQSHGGGASCRGRLYDLRKSRTEMVELIQVWAALESMSARLSTLHATDAQISGLRRLFDGYQVPTEQGLADYSSVNLAFHDAIIDLSGSQTIAHMTRNLLSQVRLIRRVTLNRSRAASLLDQDLQIMGALEGRRTELAEVLTRQQTLDLAGYISTLPPAGAFVAYSFAPATVTVTGNSGI
jgi:DNA-binding GntR family transcriptional regulator